MSRTDGHSLASALVQLDLLARPVLDARTAVVLARSLGVGADVDERGLVAVGLGDANDFAALARSHALDVDLASALLAGAAGSVDLSVVLSVEVDDLMSRVSKLCPRNAHWGLHVR